MAAPGVKLAIELIDPELNDEEREGQAQLLFQELQELFRDLKDVDELEKVDRVANPNPPEGGKSGGGFLVGLLMAEVSVTNAKRLFTFLGDRLGNKAIELSVEANGKKLSVKASSREELEAAIQAAQEFVAT